MALRYAVACCLLLVAGVATLAADPKDTDPVEVDFAPLPLAAKTDYALDYDFHAHGDTSLSGLVHMMTETPSEARDYFKKKLEKSGWVVKAEGETKLVIYSHKDAPVQKVTFKVDTFEHKVKGDVTPTVKRVKKA